MLDISVCIPVYKMENNKCEKFLIECLSHLIFQTFKNFEIVVADQSEDDSLKNICDTFSHVLNVKHVRNKSGIKNAANNVNCSIKHAKGKIVKLLFVDDYFVDNRALEKIKTAFDLNPDKSWLLAGYTHSDMERTKYWNTFLPTYDQTWVNCDNATGNPSNYSVRRECAVEMDESLLWIVDKEYFHRSYYHYGYPILLKEVLVCFREHGNSAFFDPKIRALDTVERQYWVEKYQKPVEKKLI
jgi:glycosyltransferase involved in cell wall biosynthesis